MPKTVRVRIAVAIGSDGSWHARGWSGQNELIARKRVERYFDESDVSVLPSHFWVEAELPIPEETTVQGIVRDAE